MSGITCPDVRNWQALLMEDQSAGEGEELRAIWKPVAIASRRWRPWPRPRTFGRRPSRLMENYSRKPARNRLYAAWSSG